ncbi:MAG TPA: 2'-5' RNA ligase family protein [Oscillatoriaceae cyanobacterium]
MTIDQPYGLVSLLEGTSERKLKALWAELQTEFGVRGGGPVPIAHLAYQVAGQYHVPALHDALARLARSRRPFTVQVSDVEVIEGPEPVIFLRVVRSSDLLSFQHDVWEGTYFAADELPPHYHPDRWVPHLTIANQRLSDGELARVIEFLTAKDLQWQLKIDNLALIMPGKERPRVKWRFDLG